MNENLKIEKAHQTLLMIGMFSVVMLFAGLTSAYIVSKGSLGSQWDHIILPNAFYFSTLMICVSSLFAHFALKYSSVNKFSLFTRSLLLTILFGGFFFLCQIFGWYTLVNNGKFLSGNNVASSYLYVLTLTHLFHLIGGLIPLTVVYVRSIRKQYTASNLNGVKLVVRFWHFLGLVWIYLFFFLLFIN